MVCSLLTDHHLGNSKENAKPGATLSEILAEYRIRAAKLGRFLNELNDTNWVCVALCYIQIIVLK